MAIIAGYLIDLASVGQLQKDYTPSFYLVVIILAINAVSVIKIKVCTRILKNPFSINYLPFSTFVSSRLTTTKSLIKLKKFLFSSKM
jgi:hypothetical protein